MRSQVSKHWAGKAYNSPLAQVDSSTKLKDLAGGLSGVGKNLVEKFSNTTVGDAVDFVSGPGLSEALNNAKSYISSNSEKIKKDPISAINSIEGVKK
jgi:hypothetical protein